MNSSKIALSYFNLNQKTHIFINLGKEMKTEQGLS